jgi:hypothetical protein
LTRLTNQDANRMCIATRCRTEDQFVETFARYLGTDSIFVATLATRPHGFETPFVFALVDGRPVLEGHALVRRCWMTSFSPFGRPGLELVLCNLTAPSLSVLERMHARGAVAQPHIADEVDIFSLPTRVDVETTLRFAAKSRRRVE